MAKTPLEQLHDVTTLAESDGNWDASEYHMGMANGLILARHIMEGRHDEVPYKNAPAVWAKDKPNSEPPTFVAGDAVQGTTKPVELSDGEVRRLGSTLETPPIGSDQLDDLLDSTKPLKDTTNE